MDSDTLLTDRSGWSMANCSVARAVEVMGARSTILLLREAFLGTRRFQDFAERVGITESVAAARLRDLVADGLLERVPYQEPGARTRYEYQLTRKGWDLRPAITALREWGDKYAADPEGPPVRQLHRDCGAVVHAQLRCEAGHDVGPDEMRLAAGPGLRRVPDPSSRGE